MEFTQKKVEKLIDDWLAVQRPHRNPLADFTDAAIGYVSKVEKGRTANQLAAASRRKNRPAKKGIKSRRIPGRRVKVNQAVRARRRRALLRKRAG